MPEPITLAVVAVNVGCGLLSNAMQGSAIASWGRLNGWWQAGQTPENHDVLKATHAAYVDTMARMAKAASNIALSGEERAAANALAELTQRNDFKLFRWDGEHLPLAETSERINSLFAGRHSPDDSDEGWRCYNRMIVADLALWGVDLPELTTALFVEGSAPHPPWHIMFRGHFAEMMKADAKRPEGDRAFRILTFQRLNELTASGAVIEAGIAGLHDKVDAVQADTAETLTLVRQLVESSQTQASAKNITAAALLELARRIADKVDDPQQALAALDRALDELVALREAAARGSNLGELIDEALRRAAAHNEAGAFDKGAAEFDRAYAQLREEDEARKAAKLALIDRAIDQARLGFDADAIANWVIERLTLEAAGSVTTDGLLAEQDRWYQQGLVRGLPLELKVSVVLARRAIARAPTPEERARSENDLAISLRTQGQRTGGEAGLVLLAAAVAAYRAALTVYTETAMPANWAATQNNLGAALKTQGERTGGEAGLVLLAAAVAAYRAALTVYTETAMPANWAMTQNNLGAALSTQGQRTGGEAGLVLLAAAVTAYRAALTVRTETAMPANWAMTQNNLGVALRTQGERTGGEAGLVLLAAAVTAYRAALTVYTETAMPTDWAATQNNLGVALRTQGERTGGEAGLVLLAAAVTAYRAALTVLTAEHFGHYHDIVTRNLARAEALIAERKGQRD